ncbi:MAG: hypothetical protein ACSHYB_19620 [Roseibacillus sp.]
MYKASKIFAVLALTSLNALAQPLDSGKAPEVIVYKLEGKGQVGDEGATIYSVAGSQKIEGEKEALSISKILGRRGVRPPALLDIYEGQCAVVVNKKTYYVIMLNRGIEIRAARVEGKKLQVSGESRLLGRYPKLADFLYRTTKKIEDAK